MTWYRITYEVQGRVDFPLDMLRYDCSFPYSSQDVAAIEHSRPNHGFGCTSDKDTHTVKLIRYTDSKNWVPTHGRWHSFLWSVKRDSVEVQKVG